MDWKEFFKPTKVTIIIFLIFVILSIMFGFYYPMIVGGYEVIRNPLLIPFSSQFFYCQGGCSMPGSCPELMNLCQIQSMSDYIAMEPHFFLLTIFYWYIISILITKLFYIIKRKFFP